jgi:group I intron endonuclease
MIGSIFNMAIKSFSVCPRVNGIYKLTNQKTGRFYIGKAEGKLGFYMRWYHHRQALRNNIHKNGYLQNSYNKHGEYCFTFEILEIKDYGDPLVDLESDYIVNLGAMYFAKGFNIKNEKNQSQPPKIVRENHHNSKEFELLDPEGNLIKGRNLTQFCEEFGFQQSSMFNVIKGVNKSSNGFRSPNPEFHLVKKEYRLRSPEGELIIFDNMAEFARNIGVDQSTVSRVLSGSSSNTKGYHLESPSPENQKYLDRLFNKKCLVNKDLGIIVTFVSINTFSLKYKIRRDAVYDFFSGRVNNLAKGYNWSAPTEEDMESYSIVEETF